MVAGGSDILRVAAPGFCPVPLTSTESSAVMPARSLHDSEGLQRAPAGLPPRRGSEVGRGTGAETAGLLVEVAGGGQVLGGQAERLEDGDLVRGGTARRRPGQQL